MSNLLKSSPVDTTPVGNRPTTIIQNIIEITADKTGEELCHLLRHKNSVFTYNGIPVTYVNDNNGVFEFNVWDVSSGTPKLKSYSVKEKVITAGSDIPIDSELPSVSSTDNGKVLKVVEGEWDKADESGGGDTFDLIFSADSDSRITSNSTSVTVTNASLSAVSSMDDMLEKFDAYGQIKIGGGFDWEYEITTGVDFDYIIPATINDVVRVPNAVVKALYESLPIGDKDALLVNICPVYNYGAYHGSWAVYEDNEGNMQTYYVGT